MTVLRRMASSRLVTGTMAGIYGQVIQLFIQLVSVPVMATHWGLAGYGSWLILFTVPSLLALGDFGLTTAGANTMTEAAARGDHAAAARIYAALRLVTLVIGGAVFGLAALYVLVLAPHGLDFAQGFAQGQAGLTMLMLMGYGFLALQNGVSLAGFRAADAFASSGTLYQSVILAEALGAIVAAALGYGPLAVASAYLGARLAGSVVLALYLRRVAPWLRTAPWTAPWVELRPLLAPAMAALAMPAGNAVLYQGAVMAIGAACGTAAVPAFTTVRTLSRTALQFAYRFNTASMPRYTVASALGDEAAKARLVFINLAVAVALVVPAAVGILLLGQAVIGLWTRGTIHADLALLAVMVGAMLGDAAWQPMANLIMAINRHARFTYVFLVSAALAVGAGYALALSGGAAHGAERMAWALLVQEAVMVIWVWRLLVTMGIYDGGRVAAAGRELMQMAGRTAR